jgi:hypothetical protein
VRSVNWTEVLRPMLGIPYKHRGRDEKGVDCVGYLLLAYRKAGFPIDHLDLKYNRGDALRPYFREMVARQLKREFISLNPHPFYWRDGDVVLMGCPANPAMDHHPGIVANRKVYTMTHFSRALMLDLVAPSVGAAFRHHELS